MLDFLSEERKQAGTAEQLQQNPLFVLKFLYHFRRLLWTPCLLQIVTVTKILDVSELDSWMSINYYFMKTCSSTQALSIWPTFRNTKLCTVSYI